MFFQQWKKNFKDLKLLSKYESSTSKIDSNSLNTMNSTINIQNILRKIKYFTDFKLLSKYESSTNKIDSNSLNTMISTSVLFDVCLRFFPPLIQ